MSESAIAVVPRAPLAVTNEQMTIARNTVAKDLNNDEFAVYLYNCQRQGIHPLDGLLVPVLRNDDGKKKLTFVTTVDLLRSRAAETDEYAGSDDVIFEYSGEKPIAATVTVWRFVQGQKCSFTATARYDEYFPGEKQGFMWKSKPHVMLGKCAEGLALRKAFPKQLAGLYLQEELEKDNTDRPTPVRPARAQQAPVGNVKCSECQATGGHLPKCSKRQGNTAAQAPAKSEPIMCGTCGKTDSHDPTCKYATGGATAVPTKAQTVVLIVGIDRLQKKADKNGKREPYIKLKVVNNANEEFDLFVWHKTPQEYLTDAVLDKPMMCEISIGKKTDGTEYRSLENILEIAGQKFSDNKPAAVQGTVVEEF